MAAFEPWKCRDWLEKQYWGRERSYQKIADNMGTTHSTIRHWMEKLDVPRRTLSEANADGDIAKLRNRDWLYEQYHEKGLSARQIGKQLECYNDTVLNWTDRHGIERKHRSEIMSNGDVQKLHDRGWLKQEYQNKQRPAPEIADQCNVDSATVYHWLEVHGIDIRHVAETRSNGDVQKLMDKDWLKEMYVERGLSSHKIADKLNQSKNSVLCWLDKHGIETRELHPVGPEHPNWKENSTDYFGPNWPEQRLKARVRDQARCQVCGKTDSNHLSEYGKRNHVHHIKPRSKFLDADGLLDYKEANKLSNLITLCAKHHKQREGLPIDNRN